MGAASAVIAVRLLLNIVILCGASTVIYGIVTSTTNVGRYTHGASSQCYLWGKVTSDGIYTSTNHSCYFAIVASVVSILLALMFTAIFIYNLKSGDPSKRTWLSVLEVFFMIINFCVVLSLGVVVSGGLAALCSNTKTYRIHSSCSYLGIKDVDDEKKKPYYLYKDLNIAQIGTWVLMTCWLFHLIFSCINCCLYHKGKSQRVQLTTNTTPDDEKALLA